MKNNYKNIFLTFLIALSSMFGFSQTDKSITSSNQSYVPIIAYDGTYGLILGVAYFRYPNFKSPEPSKKELDILLYAAGGPVISLDTRWRKNQLTPNLDVQISTELSNFFIRDYPNGQAEGHLINQETAVIKGQLIQKLKPSHNIVYDLILENKDFENGAPNQYKTGTSIISAIGYLIDTRGPVKSSTNKGYSFQSTLSAKPNFLSTIEDGTFSTKLELDGRYYKALTKNQTFASRAYFQLSNGNLFNSKFGGSSLMRGFNSNRFIGSQALTLQNEWRIQFNKRIGSALFASFGQIDTQDDILINYGLGIRIGLPPDQTQKVRIDFGFNTDGQSTFMLQFNQAI